MVVTDFEKGLMNAVESELNDVTVAGCFFHWKQALQRKIGELGLASRYGKSNIYT